MNATISKAFNKKLLPLLLFLFLYTSLEIALLYFLLISSVEHKLKQASDRVLDDLVLKDGVWDVSSYNADSNISDESSLYIISSEGFVIERSRPIHGLLDLSRYSAIDNYSAPQILTAPTNEKWRVFSMPLMSGDKGVGIIMVAKYDPNERDLPEIDKQIQDIATQISANIEINEDSIDVNKIDLRKIPFDISFQIVNRFNKVLLQSHNNNSVSRIPSFIDRSYIDNQIKGSSMKQVEDVITHKKYLTLTTPVYGEKKLLAGIIVVGEPIEDIYWTVKTYGISNLLINIFLIVLAVPAGSFYFRMIRRNNQGKNKVRPDPKTITFMRKACKLVVDGQNVDIPYASFQYYFCDALFQRPKKKWEVDELLQIFGEDFGVEKWRKVYDTMVALDKKTSSLVEKLFMVKSKRYFINPQFLPLINYVNI